jgi:uncharacterized membrane protein YfcA
MRRTLLTVLAAIALIAAPALAAAPAGAAATSTTTVSGGPSTARLGGFDRRRGRGGGCLRGLFHGLFWGWLLSHFLGGGFPLILPLLLLVVVVVLARRRRSPPPSDRAW